MIAVITAEAHSKFAAPITSPAARFAVDVVVTVVEPEVNVDPTVRTGWAPAIIGVTLVTYVVAGAKAVEFAVAPYPTMVTEVTLAGT